MRMDVVVEGERWTCAEETAACISLVNCNGAAIDFWEGSFRVAPGLGVMVFVLCASRLTGIGRLLPL